MNLEDLRKLKFPAGFGKREKRNKIPETKKEELKSRC